MQSDPREIEVKFYVTRVGGLRRRILDAGGELRSPRTREFNLRYDTSNGDFRRTGQVLRLRRDRITRLTYKGPPRASGGILNRTEIEVEVSDFDAAQQLLRSLGYGVAFTYEKYRTAFSLQASEIDLDELPFGNFVEIEGDPLELQPLAATLGLSWLAAIPYGYHDLFERLRLARSLPFTDLTFANFVGVDISPSELGVTPADK